MFLLRYIYKFFKSSTAVYIQWVLSGCLIYPINYIGERWLRFLIKCKNTRLKSRLCLIIPTHRLSSGLFRSIYIYRVLHEYSIYVYVCWLIGIRLKSAQDTRDREGFTLKSIQFMLSWVSWDVWTCNMKVGADFGECLSHLFDSTRFDSIRLRPRWHAAVSGFGFLFKSRFNLLRNSNSCSSYSSGAPYSTSP